LLIADVFLLFVLFLPCFVGDDSNLSPSSSLSPPPSSSSSSCVFSSSPVSRHVIRTGGPSHKHCFKRSYHETGAAVKTKVTTIIPTDNEIIEDNHKKIDVAVDVLTSQTKSLSIHQSQSHCKSPFIPSSCQTTTTTTFDDDSSISTLSTCKSRRPLSYKEEEKSASTASASSNFISRVVSFFSRKKAENVRVNIASADNNNNNDDDGGHNSYTVYVVDNQKERQIC
jgi:hypothetical protein